MEVTAQTPQHTFRIDGCDGGTWLVTNLELEQKGCKPIPQCRNFTELVNEFLNLSHQKSQGVSQCWVLIEGNECRIGDVVLGQLSHSPLESLRRGLPVLSVYEKTSRQGHVATFYNHRK